MIYDSHAIHNYVPEKLQLEGKHGRSSRVCREGFGIFSAADRFRRLISCGTVATPMQEAFLEEGIRREELGFLKAALKSHGRVLLQAAEGSLLVFGDWLNSTGLVLSVRLPEPKNAVMQALGMMGREDFAISPDEEESPRAIRASADEVLEHLAEIFYYLDRILSPSAELGLLTRATLIAELIGCHADCTALPLTFPSLLSHKASSLTAFLFCAFLSLRREHVSAESEEARGRFPSFRCTLSAVEERVTQPSEEEIEEKREFSWMGHPAFAPFEISVGENGISLQAELTQEMLLPQLHAETMAKRMLLSVLVA